MSSFKIAVFLSGNGSNLQSLIDTKKINNDHSLNISVVFSNNKNALGIKRAKENNIPFFTLDPKKFNSREAFDEAIIDKLKNFDFDLLVLAGYMKILSEKFVKTYEDKIINLHPSLLPKYPGLNTHEKILKNKEIHHGATVHFVDSGLDTGQIIGYSKFEVNDHDLTSLEQKVHEIEHKLLPLICSLIKNDEIKFIDKILTINGLEYSNGKEYIF